MHRDKHLQFREVQTFTKRQLPSLYIKPFPPSLTFHHITSSLHAIFLFLHLPFWVSYVRLCTVLFAIFN